MGRCNNRRAREAAENLRKTPSRARFSKQPNNQRKKTGRNDKKNNKAPAAVVQKIVKRVETKDIAARVSKPRPKGPLDGIDITRLDELKLSEKTTNMLIGLLGELNIIQTESSNSLPKNDSPVVSIEKEEALAVKSEYEDDYMEEDGFLMHHVTPNIDDTDWEGGTEEIETSALENLDTLEETAQDIEDSTSSPVSESLRRDPVFSRLTEFLSFTEQDAAKACGALESWLAVIGSKNVETQSDTSARLNAALDWLCLHLNEGELELGLRRNPKLSESASYSGLYGPRKEGAAVGRAIPHPSISVAVKLTDDYEWQKQALLDEEAVKFLSLGFQYQESLDACRKVGTESVAGVEALDNIAVLMLLLEDMERTIWLEAGEQPCNRADYNALTPSEEQVEEIEALKAIYDDQMATLGSVENCRHYSIQLNDVDPEVTGNRPKLHILLQSGYPESLPPLGILVDSSLPPQLLRRVNESMTHHLIEFLGTPSIFELITFLSDSLPEMYKDFVREQKTRDFEAEQVRLRQEADGVSLEDAADETHGKRQRRREKQSIKAYHSPQELEEQENERRKRQNDRVLRAQTEDRDIRSTMAERAIQQRNEELEQQSIEKAARAAMVRALNEGASPSAAREMADAIRKQDADPNENNGDETPKVRTSVAKFEIADEDTGTSNLVASNPSAGTSNLVASNPSETTAAFLDRLRAMYLSASESGNQNEVCKLSDPGELSETTSIKESLTTSSIPNPIAFPVGDVAQAVEIIEAQADQPWLVAKEARALTVKSTNGQTHDVERERDEASSVLLKEFQAKQRTGAATEMLKVRSNLPAYHASEEILDTIAGNQVSVVSGATGSGKSTQVPQLVLDDMITKGMGSSANIIVTQPRRISAIGVAERVAAERIERIGETCGYSIKLEKKWSKKTRLLFCTTGILLRRLQCDPDLASVSHVFVDEVHERDLNTDFLLIILKSLLSRRSSIKLVLMSATVNATTFSDFFGGCAVVSIPGRTFPVEEHRLEEILSLTQYEVKEDSDYAWKGKGSVNRPSKSALRKLYYPRYKSSVIHSLSVVDESQVNYELLAELLEYICLNNDQGAILVFLPGMMEIGKAADEMRRKELFQSHDRVIIYPLHSSLSTAEQSAVFDVPPPGVRKIVLATNIAETSITIEDVVYVVDSGRVKENRRDEVKETPALVECWVSRASAKQRRGRAGRVRPGVAYHMFSSHTHDNVMCDYQLPEMLRVGLEELVLQILILDLGQPSSFLSMALNPPSSLALRSSLKLLEGLGAVECQWGTELDETANTRLTKDGHILSESCSNVDVETELTALGYNLATLPVEPRVGKMIIYGSMFGCIDPALTIAASMSSKNVFASSFENREEADNRRAVFSPERSDHLATLRVFNKWRELRVQSTKAAANFIQKNFLSKLTLFQMEDLRRQYSTLLADIGFLPKGFKMGGKGKSAARPALMGPNRNGENIAMVKAVLAAGLYPNIIVAPRALADGSATQEAAQYTFNSLKGDVHLHPSTLSFHAKHLESRYACYHEIVKTSKTYVRDFTTASPYALLLFGGKLVVHHSKGVVTVDDFIKFRISASSATLIKHLRSQMERVLLDKIVDPGLDLVDIPSAQALIHAVNTLLENEKVESPQLRSDGAEIVRPYHMPDRGGGNRAGGRGPRGGRGRGRSRGQNNPSSQARRPV